MFVNLSNHPSNKWNDEQLDAAVKLAGKVVDYPFPDVSPMWSVEKIRQVAVEIVSDILFKYDRENLVVHVAGEFTLCFAIVSYLQSRGVRCVASCTFRQVEDKADGSKLSVFKFIQFREYTL